MRAKTFRHAISPTIVFAGGVEVIFFLFSFLGLFACEFHAAGGNGQMLAMCRRCRGPARGKPVAICVGEDKRLASSMTADQKHGRLNVLTPIWVGRTASERPRLCLLSGQGIYVVSAVSTFGRSKVAGGLAHPKSP